MKEYIFFLGFGLFFFLIVLDEFFFHEEIIFDSF